MKWQTVSKSEFGMATTELELANTLKYAANSTEESSLVK